MPSSVFYPGCSFIVILNDHFQQRCSSARSPKHPFHQSPYSLSLVSLSLLQRAAVHLSAAYVSVHPCCSFTQQDGSQSMTAEHLKPGHVLAKGVSGGSVRSRHHERTLHNRQ